MNQNTELLNQHVGREVRVNLVDTRARRRPEYRQYTGVLISPVNDAIVLRSNHGDDHIPLDKVTIVGVVPDHPVVPLDTTTNDI